MKFHIFVYDLLFWNISIYFFYFQFRFFFKTKLKCFCESNLSYFCLFFWYNFCVTTNVSINNVNYDWNHLSSFFLLNFKFCIITIDIKNASRVIKKNVTLTDIEDILFMSIKDVLFTNIRDVSFTNIKNVSFISIEYDSIVKIFSTMRLVSTISSNCEI